MQLQSDFFYLEDVWYGVVEMFPLLRVEVLQLSSVLVLTLISRVSPQVELGFGLNSVQTLESLKVQPEQSLVCPTHRLYTRDGQPDSSLKVKPKHLDHPPGGGLQYSKNSNNFFP